jgi:hypothetical protein
VPGERQQGRVEADGLPLALQHGALQVVVEQHPRHAAKGLEGPGMAAQEVLHAGVEEEAQEYLPRIGQHHDEGHQRAAGAAYLEMPEVAPVDLGLFAGQGAQAQVGLGRRARTVQGDEVAEMVRPARVAALAGHLVQAAGGEGGELPQRLPEEGQVGVDLRGALRMPGPGQAGLGQHPLHGAVVQAQLAGDGADAPFLGVVVTEDLGLQFLGNGHAVFLLRLLVGGTRRGRKPNRTAPAQRQPQKSQCRAATDAGLAGVCGRRAATIEFAASRPSGGGTGEP